MPKTTSILDGINDEALAFRRAQSQYDAVFRGFLMTTPRLSPEHFWPMLDAFRLTVLRTMMLREKVAEAAADEFMRDAKVNKGPGGLAAAVHFAISYRDFVRKAYSGGDKCGFGFDRGDDGYSDLMDAVVLLGREFNERLYEGDFGSLAAFGQAVMGACCYSVTERDFPFQYADDPVGNRTSLAGRLRKFVLHGENYFSMSLEEAAQKWVALAASDATEEND
jgi:hypothetical protein